MAYRRQPPTRRRPGLVFAEFCPPRHDGFCRCNCGERLQGRERQWRRGHDTPIVRAFKIQNGDTQAIRAACYDRDRGICAICALDTYQAQASCYAEREFFGRKFRHCRGARSADEARENRERFIRLGFPYPGQRSWWEADHILPLAEGGTNAIENFRTLCVACHRAETASLARRLADRRRDGGTPELPLSISTPPTEGPPVRANLPGLGSLTTRRRAVMTRGF